MLRIELKCFFHCSFSIMVAFLKVKANCQVVVALVIGSVHLQTAFIILNGLLVVSNGEVGIS